MRTQGRNVRIGMLAALLSSTIAVAPSAQTPSQNSAPLSYNLYGLPGLIDMPTAQTMPDAQLAGTVSAAGDGSRRRTLAFQITPRIAGSFRYSTLDDFNANGALFDRSFDLRYLMLKETRFRPAVLVGLQDFIGTGIYSGEYVVATKTLPSQVTVSGGLGWGRLGTRSPFTTIGTRPSQLIGRGGVPNAERFFQGDVAAFGGIAWSPSDRWTLKAEYSSDDYVEENARGIIDTRHGFNFGADYRFRSGTQLSLYSLYGTEFGFQVTVQVNPKTLGVPGGVEQAPLPVGVRAPGAAADLGWTLADDPGADSAASLRDLAANEGLVVEAIRLEPRRATVRLRNPRYGAPAQAIGRLARAMSRSLPASIEEFEIVPMVDGMAMSSVIIRRSDLETLENEAATEMLARTRIIDGFGRVPAVDPGLHPRFTYSVAPYLGLSFFDPQSPVRYDFGIRAAADYVVMPNVVLSGSVTKRLAGTVGGRDPDESGLPRVRTDSALFADQGDPALEYLTLDFYGRPARDLYGRVTLGYLEAMYAGASTELLWKPVDSRLAVGAEVNYVERRDFDKGFGLQGNTTFDPVTGITRSFPKVNGHLSAYYDFGNGFHGQVNAGRFLAGDVGARFVLDREFANGVKVGAFATFTDVSADEFGEGSFDKGLRFTVPFSVLTNTPSRRESAFTLRSLTRDGGAMVNVRGRLYDKVRDYHEPEAAKSWGRFWR